MLIVCTVWALRYRAWNQKDRVAAIRSRIDEPIEVIAQAICDNKEPVAAQCVLTALAARLAAEEAPQTGNAGAAQSACAMEVGFDCLCGTKSSSSGLRPGPSGGGSDSSDGRCGVT